MAAEYEIVTRFPEINPSNYDHDDVCNLNNWGIEAAATIVALAEALERISHHDPKSGPGVLHFDSPEQLIESATSIARTELARLKGDSA